MALFSIALSVEKRSSSMKHGIVGLDRSSLVFAGLATLLGGLQIVVGLVELLGEGQAFTTLRLSGAGREEGPGSSREEILQHEHGDVIGCSLQPVVIGHEQSCIEM